MSFLQLRSKFFKNPLAIPPSSSPSASVSGTATETINESNIVTGGKTILITLTNDTWVASGATFNAIRQDIINNIDSAQSEVTGWDAVVKATQGVTGVVRTSDTIVTITLDAFATYDITSTETITVTIPSTAVSSSTSYGATPTFQIAVSSGIIQQLLTMLGVGS